MQKKSKKRQTMSDEALFVDFGRTQTFQSLKERKYLSELTLKTNSD